MKALISIMIMGMLLTNLSCSDKDNPPSVVAPNETGLFLTQTESSLLTRSFWCETTKMAFKGNECNPILISHAYTKFSNKEYYVEVSYPAQERVWCEGLYLEPKEINNTLESASYRVSFTGKNLATLTQISQSKDAKDVEFFVDGTSLVYAPLDKSLKPGRLSSCTVN